MAVALRKTQVVIVGLGAAGGVAALPLVRAGLEVIGLEAGQWLEPRDFAPDELRNNYRGWPHALQKANRENPTGRANASAASVTRGAIASNMNGVGGTSLHYWGQSWRLNPWDFRVVSETRRRYGISRLPKGTTVEDWPLGYDDLEPYYDKVEYEIGVSGKAGNIQGRLDPAGNIFEGPRQREFPMPPLRRTAFTELMADAARRLGWKPFPGPAAINSRPYGNRSACAYHGFCDRGGCHVRAKASTAVTTIPRAQEAGLQVVTGAHVIRVETDREGRASGVIFVRNGEEYFQPADVVLLSSFVFENVRLLLLSKSSAYPKGLSNNHNQVGRHYFSHNLVGGVTALFPHDLGNWYGTPAQGVGVDEWADDNFDHGRFDFIGGGNLWVYSDRRPIAAANMNTFGLSPAWGSAWKAFVHDSADRQNTAYLQKTTLPYEDNYLDLDPVVRDPLGQPVVRITAEFKENERKIGAFVQEKMVAWFQEAGAVAVERGSLAGGMMGNSSHNYGGTRMGDNPETSVVDRWGFSHEVPNLGILGGSVMGTSGSHNPTLTIQALAWRTAEYLATRWRTIAR